GVSLDQSVNEPTFRDVCTKSGKWFRALLNCFVGQNATKHSEQKKRGISMCGQCGTGDLD
ncbi:hypothetical protein, partial [Bradyrhizobium sp. NAS80.1]|uniref:hypothetical protein n=1 Tax=Bradyrhizobium sp. NAS80.1 TaxID=1680159 RepID=UPI001AEF37A1